MNSSSKLCISKRLAITSLLLIGVAFSVVVFSTLSSSVNKTTSSKAAGLESNTLIQVGGWGEPCEVGNGVSGTSFGELYYPELKCNKDSDLTCVASLDFYLKDPKKRKSYDETKCLKYSEIPMGKEGQLCLDVPERVGQFRCEKGLVCAKALDNGFTGLPTGIMMDYLRYLYGKYDSTAREKLIFSYNSTDAEKNKKLYVETSSFVQIFRHLIMNFTHAEEGFLKEPPGICIQNSLSTTDNCGEKGQYPCFDEGGQLFCSNNFRVSYSNESGRKECSPKIKVEKKGLFTCDNMSGTCDEFCTSINSKCVDTCEETIYSQLPGGDPYAASTIRGGMFQTIEGGSKVSGKCTDKYFIKGNYAQNYVCTSKSGISCCCDKLK